MARITGPVWKKSRRLGFSILETGEELTKRNYAHCVRFVTAFHFFVVKFLLRGPRLSSGRFPFGRVRRPGFG